MANLIHSKHTVIITIVVISIRIQYSSQLGMYWCYLNHVN